MINRTIWFKAAAISYFCFLWAANVCASPMRAPTLEEAIQRSEYIVVAEYSNYSKRLNKIDYFYGPRAAYRVIEVLKGDPLPKMAQIEYGFRDGSACVAPSDWSFDEKIMPQKGSRWILFFESKDDQEGIWKTYRGDYGRWKFTEENSGKIKNQLKK